MHWTMDRQEKEMVLEYQCSRLNCYGLVLPYGDRAEVMPEYRLCRHSTSELWGDFPLQIYSLSNLIVWWSWRPCSTRPLHCLPEEEEPCTQEVQTRIEVRKQLARVPTLLVRGYQLCWCKGFNIGRGVVCAISTRILHAKRVKESKERK